MKRILVLLVLVAVLLCGCGNLGDLMMSDWEMPQLPTVPDLEDLEIPDWEPEYTIPDITIPEFSIPELPTLPEFTVPELPTIPEFTMPELPTLPYGIVTVQDRYCEIYENPYVSGMHYCVHIPSLSCDGQDCVLLNDQIYFDHMARLSQGGNYDQPMVEVNYSLGQAKGYASVVSSFSNQDYDYVTYSIFHVDAATGQEANDDQILAAFGYDRDSFRQKVTQVLEQEFLSHNYEQWVDQQTYQETLALQISGSNVDAARPFIDEQGRLCIVAYVYGFAGSGQWQSRLCLEDPSMIPSPESIQCKVHG